MVNGQLSTSSPSLVNHSRFTIDDSHYYSVRNDFTGFAIAALID
jgi:hypothetical protein